MQSPLIFQACISSNRGNRRTARPIHKERNRQQSPFFSTVGNINCDRVPLNACSEFPPINLQPCVSQSLHMHHIPPECWRILGHCHHLVVLLEQMPLRMRIKVLHSLQRTHAVHLLINLSPVLMILLIPCMIQVACGERVLQRRMVKWMLPS